MAMQVKLTEGDEASTKTSEKFFRGKHGLECYLKVLEGAHYVQTMSIEGNNTARLIAEEIVTRWPDNPYGYLLLGWVYRMDLMSGSAKTLQESLEKATELVQKTLAMDDSLATAHGLLSSIYSQKREHDKAIAEGERAVALDPGGSFAHEIYAMSLYFAGRWKEAIPMFEKAIRLNPIGSTSAFSTLGSVYALIGRIDEAVSAYKQALLRSPDNLYAHVGLASAYIRMGREKEARAEAPKSSGYIQSLPWTLLPRQFLLVITDNGSIYCNVAQGRSALRLWGFLLVQSNKQGFSRLSTHRSALVSLAGGVFG